MRLWLLLWCLAGVASAAADEAETGGIPFFSQKIKELKSGDVSKALKNKMKGLRKLVPALTRLSDVDVGIDPSAKDIYVYRSTKPPFHTWIHFPNECDELTDKEERQRAGCSDDKESVLNYQNIGFTRALWETPRQYLTTFPGAFAVENNHRKKKIVRRFKGVPERCGRLALALVLNEFLQVDHSNLVYPKPVRYMLFEGVLKTFRRNPQVVPQFSYVFIPGVRNNATNKTMFSHVRYTKRTATNSQLNSAVCWTFTSRFGEVLRRARSLLTNGELDNNCDNIIVDHVFRSSKKDFHPSAIWSNRCPPPSAGFLLIDRRGWHAKKKMMGLRSKWACGVAKQHPNTKCDHEGPIHKTRTKWFQNMKQLRRSWGSELERLMTANPYWDRSMFQYAIDWFKPNLKNKHGMAIEPPAADLQKSSEKKPLKLAFVGDVQPAKYKSKRGLFGKKIHDFPVRSVAHFKSDLLIANLECTVVDERVVKRQILVFKMRLQNLLDTCQGWGFRPHQVVLNVANNHALDGKPAAAYHTARLIKKAGFHVTGFRPELDAEVTAKSMITVVTTARGHRVGVVGFTQLINNVKRHNARMKIPVFFLRGDEMTKFDWVAAKKELKLDSLVVTTHWGWENYAFPKPSDVNLGQQLMKMGFDVVAGHGSHFVQPVVVDNSNKAVMFTSMGNFVPSGSTMGPALCGGAFIVDIEPAKGVARYEVRPTVMVEPKNNENRYHRGDVDHFLMYYLEYHDVRRHFPKLYQSCTNYLSLVLDVKDRSLKSYATAYTRVEPATVFANNLAEIKRMHMRRLKARANRKKKQSDSRSFLGTIQQTLGVGQSKDSTASTRRGPTKLDSIALIGAGPAGLHMASRLKKMGYFVDVFERSERVGGKSYTLYRTKDGKPCHLHVGAKRNPECLPHDMGTSFMTNAFKSRIFPLFKEYGLREPKGHVDELAFYYDGPLWHPTKGYPYKYKGQVPAVQLQLGLVGKILIQDGANPAKLTVKKVVKALASAIKKYSKLHKKFFKRGKWLMPESRPSADVMKELSKSFTDYLTDHKLKCLIPLLDFGYAAQGYGYPSEVSAYYGMVWMTPETFHGWMMMALHKGKGTASKLVQGVTKVWRGAGLRLGWFLSGIKTGFHADPTDSVLLTAPDGWQPLWEKMALQDRVSVHYGVHIESINRNLENRSKPIEIKYRSKRDGKATGMFDWLIYTPNPFKDFSGQGTIKDVQPEEEKLFSKQKTYQLTTTLYRSPPMPTFSDAKSNNFVAFWNKVVEDKHNNVEYFERYDAPAYGVDGVSKRHFGLQERVAYQFSSELQVPIDKMPYERTAQEDTEADRTIRALLRDVVKQRGINISAMEIVKDAVNSRATGIDRLDGPQRLAQFPWPYFPHWEPQDTGLAFDLLELQGKYRTWYSGSFASFESVLNVVDYNCRLLKEHLGESCQWVKK